MSPEKQQEVLDSLKKKNVSLKCPACPATEELMLTKFYSPMPIQEVMPFDYPPENTFTCALLICRSCGYLQQHSFYPLDIGYTPGQ